MKCHIPQISWHNRDPVLSIDFQPCQDNVRRLATAGTDAHVHIWLVTLKSNGSTSLEFASDLNRHTKTVNIVRFSPNGEILASGDDEAIIILWKQQKDLVDLFVEEDSQNKEHWSALKVLRGHLDDVCDISWSANSLFLISGSVDNTAILWDIQKGKNIGLLKDPKGFVQGVAWDPLHQHVATLSSDRILGSLNGNKDAVAYNLGRIFLLFPTYSGPWFVDLFTFDAVRTLRIYNIHNKRVMCKIQKTNSSLDKDKQPSKPTRIFYDDTLKSFCRRLTFSPDGEMLIVPSGIIELEEGNFTNTTYVFSRNSFNKPVVHLPTGTKYTVAVRCCPTYFELVPQKDSDTDSNMNKPWEKYNSLWSLPYRMVFAVATQDSVLIYDTQHTLPLALITNIHYTHLTDLAWSSDGRCLIASSTDGYCSFITFCENELGIPYIKAKEDSVVQGDRKIKMEKPVETEEAKALMETANQSTINEDADELNRACLQETPRTPKQKKVEVCQDIQTKDKDSSQWKLSLETSNSPPASLKVSSNCKITKPSASETKKTGRRIQFVTLSTPKAKKC